MACSRILVLRLRPPDWVRRMRLVDSLALATY